MTTKIDPNVALAGGLTLAQLIELRDCNPVEYARHVQTYGVSVASPTDERGGNARLARLRPTPATSEEKARNVRDALMWSRPMPTAAEEQAQELAAIRIAARSAS